MQVSLRDFFAPLRTSDMDADTEEQQEAEADEERTQTPRTERPPQILLTAVANLIQLQKQIQDFVKGTFEVPEMGQRL